MGVDIGLPSVAKTHNILMELLNIKSGVSLRVAVRQVIFTHEQGSRLGFEVLVR